MSEDAAPILCQKCGKIFKAKRTLSIHQKNPCKPPGSDSSSDTKFACECGNTYNSLKNFRDHRTRYCLGRVEKLDQLLEHKDDSDEFKCVRCGKMYNSGPALSQHQRRYCKHHADNMGFYACTYCPRQFNTLIGVRQHIRHTHPMEYDKELEVQHLQVKQGWTSIEIAKMAEVEATFEGKNINEFLITESKRTLDSIKGKRRDPIYRELVRKAKERKEYDKEMEVQHLQVKQGWTSVEIAKMAEVEATFEGKNINAFLITKSKRTLDSIKGKRRDPIYRELVRKAKERKNLNS